MVLVDLHICQVFSIFLLLKMGKEKSNEFIDIFITRNGKVVAKLSSPNADRVEMAQSLLGVIPADITLEEARAERADKL